MRNIQNIKELAAPLAQLALTNSKVISYNNIIEHTTEPIVTSITHHFNYYLERHLRTNPLGLRVCKSSTEALYPYSIGYSRKERLVGTQYSYLEYDLKLDIVFNNIVPSPHPLHLIENIKISTFYGDTSNPIREESLDVVVDTTLSSYIEVNTYGEPFLQQASADTQKAPRIGMYIQPNTLLDIRHKQAKQDKEYAQLLVLDCIANLCNTSLADLITCLEVNQEHFLNIAIYQPKLAKEHLLSICQNKN